MNAQVLGTFTELAFHCTKFVLFNFTLPERVEAHTHVLHIYMDKFSLLTSQIKSPDSWAVVTS